MQSGLEEQLILSAGAALEYKLEAVQTALHAIDLLTF